MIQMEAPRWAVGDEKRFLGYVESLKSAKRIVLVSHTDQDGIAAAKVIARAVNPHDIHFVDYTDLNSDFVEILQSAGASHVIFSDLMIKERGFIGRIEEFAEVLIIDHHPAEIDYTSAKTVFMNAQGFCAAYLSYYLFSKKVNLEELDWIVACASVSDWAYFENRGWMTGVFAKYDDVFIADKELIKKTKFWEVQATISMALIYFKKDLRHVYDSLGEQFGDLGTLNRYAKEVQMEIDANILKYEKEKQAIEGGFFWEFESKFPIKSIVSTIISASIPDTTILIAERRGDVYHLSARRQDRKKSMNELLKKFTEGFENHDAGGHIPAAGGHIQVKDVSEFKKRLGVK